ncbi:MAG: PEP-CTERM sorting domain-containing protein [Planctomycetaceae bacterium]
MSQLSRSGVSIIAAQAVVLLCLQAHAQLRILDYNVAASGSASSGPRAGMDSVLRAINAQNRPGFSKPVDIMLMQEADSVSTTGLAYANLLNVITGGTTYLASTVDGSSAGSGRPIVVYNSAAVTLISEVGVGVVSSTGQPRQTMRYQFRPVGYDSNADFYVYNSHLKASTGSTNEARRNVETTNTRANADALGDGTSIIYVGDLNLYDSTEAAFQTLLAPGNGQAFDPINQIGSWSGNAVYKAFHTQSPATTAAYGGQVTGGMDDRFDFQLVSGEWLDGRGLDFISGSYWAFGNTGTHNLNGAITTGSASALQAFLPGYTVAQSGTVLTLLSQVADHLPVVADYQLPAKMSAGLAMLPSKVIVGAAVSGTLTVSNSAPVSVVQGADRLDYTFSSSGLFTGSGTGSDMALGPANAHTLSLKTGTAGLISGTVSVQATSPQTASPSFSQTASVSVLDHAIGSFTLGSTLTTLDLDFGLLTQGTGTASQTFSIFNRAGGSWAARLDLDSISASAPGSVFTTTLSPFTNLASGSSRSYGVSMLTTTTGSFSGTYSLNLSDEDLPGAATQSLSLTVRGRVASPANAILNVASGTQTQLGLGFAAITGSSSITKTGSGSILLDLANTFTGTTSIEQGVTVLGASGAIAGSARVNIAAGASLDARTLAGGYVVGTGQTLGGEGTILGSVTFGAGSTIAPGSPGAAVSLGSLQVVAVPEPGTWVMAVAGLAWVASRRRRSR